MIRFWEASKQLWWRALSSRAAHGNEFVYTGDVTRGFICWGLWIDPIIGDCLLPVGYLGIRSVNYVLILSVRTWNIHKSFWLDNLVICSLSQPPPPDSPSSATQYGLKFPIPHSRLFYNNFPSLFQNMRIGRFKILLFLHYDLKSYCCLTLWFYKWNALKEGKGLIE